MRKLLLVLAIASTQAVAGPYGYDLHTVLAPASGGVSGTALATPLDNVSAVYGNPATLTQFEGTEFTFGATWYKPEVELEHDGFLGTFDRHNGNEGYIVPQIAITQDLRGFDIPATVGLGLSAVSGIGAEFRGDESTLGVGAEFIIFGANAGLGYELTDQWSVGYTGTITFAQMDLGLASTSAQTHDVSYRHTLGTTYEITEATTIGAFAQSKLKHQFSDLLLVSNGDDTGTFQSVTIEQPRNYGLGISHQLNPDLIVMADVMYKEWSETEFWGDIYDDQWVFSLGAEYTRGNWKYRAGYGYAEDPTKRDLDGLADIGAVCAGLPGACTEIELSTPVLEYLQAAEAEVIYKHRVTAGIGYDNVLGTPISINTHVGLQLEEDRDYGDHTNAEVYSWHAGMGLTWNF